MTSILPKPQKDEKNIKQSTLTNISNESVHSRLLRDLQFSSKHHITHRSPTEVTTRTQLSLPYPGEARTTQSPGPFFCSELWSKIHTKAHQLSPAVYNPRPDLHMHFKSQKPQSKSLQ